MRKGRLGNRMSPPTPTPKSSGGLPRKKTGSQLRHALAAVGTAAVEAALCSQLAGLARCSPEEEACSVTAHVCQAHYHMMPENGSCLLESFIVVRCCRTSEKGMTDREMREMRDKGEVMISAAMLPRRRANGFISRRREASISRTQIYK
nr:hypothetical protein Iba_chr12aCG13330 [Ipomoea batatas]